MVRFRRGDRWRLGGTDKKHLPDGQRERGIGVYREACEWRISTENPYADRSTPTGGG